MNKLLYLLLITSLSADISFDIDESLYKDVEDKADAEFKEVTKRQLKIVKKIVTGIIPPNYTYPNNYSNLSSKSQDRDFTSNQNSSKRKQKNISKGIKHIKNNGKIGGVATYLIVCKSGKSTVIKKLKGSWYTGFLGFMGHKFDNWSKVEVGEYICKN